MPAQQALCNAGFVCCDIIMFLVNVRDTKPSIFSVENYGIVFCVMKLEKELMLLKLLEKHTGKQNIAEKRNGIFYLY